MGLTLEISSVYKSYDGKPVLQDCSCLFKKTGTYVLMGPNGSGKSTFFRICALLEEPDRGDVNYLSGGILMEKNINLRRKITLLLPKVGVFNTTVLKNVACGALVPALAAVLSRLRGAFRLSSGYRVVGRALPVRPTVNPPRAVPASPQPGALP